MRDNYADRIAGVIYGTALGDALGLYVEGLSAAVIARRFGKIDRFLIPGGIGLLSDDTEHTALIAESLILHSTDVVAFERHLRWCLVQWFWSLPPGIGMATMKACLRMTMGLPQPGVRSAGNGSAMRAAIIGAYFSDNEQSRREFGLSAAKLTHTDDRAVAGSLFVADLSAACIRSDAAASRFELFDTALANPDSQPLRVQLEQARQLAQDGGSALEAGKALGTTGFVVHTVPFAAFCFLRFDDEPMEALSQAISAGGDTDSIAAILGAWLGALHGQSALNAKLIDRLFLGPIDLKGLSHCLVEPGKFNKFCYPVALVKNLVSLPYLLIVAICRRFY